MPKKPKLTAAEKESRKHQRKAKRMNAAEAKAYGPLFAHLAPTHTASTAYRNWRLLKASTAEQDWNSTLHRYYEWITLSNVERFAAELLGQDLAAEVAANLRHAYEGKPDYILSAWSDVLGGRRTVPNWRMRVVGREANGLNKLTFEPWVLPCAPIPREDFDRRFPRRIDLGKSPTDDQAEHEESFRHFLAALSQTALESNYSVG